MAKLPKNHPTIIELTKKIEYAQKHAKDEYKEMKRKMGIQLKKIFDKQLAKHREAERAIIRKLEIIASRKQNHDKW